MLPPFFVPGRFPDPVGKRKSYIVRCNWVGVPPVAAALYSASLHRAAATLCLFGFAVTIA